MLKKKKKNYKEIKKARNKIKAIKNESATKNMKRYIMFKIN
jgi:hypothetical protein